MTYRKIDGYFTIRHGDPTELDAMVEKAIKSGWEPFGSQYVDPRYSGRDVDGNLKQLSICQPMVWYVVVVSNGE